MTGDHNPLSLFLRRVVFTVVSLLLIVTPFVPTQTQVEAKRSFREIQELTQLERLHSILDTPQSNNGAIDSLLDFRSALTTTESAVDNRTSPPELPTLYNATVRLPINHFGRSPPPYTFLNRFWVVDKYYKPGGPVFTFDTGESDDGYLYRGYLLKNESFFNSYLREFGGLGILWEHRYYGQSTPYPIDLNTTSEQMQWLTTDQALKDFVVFANRFKWKIGGPDAKVSGRNGSLIGQRVDFNPRRTPWIHVGGSYPGMRAAMLRDKYPDTVFAAYASSAPVQASVDMTFYWDQVYRGMVAYGYGNCTRDMKSALDYIDSQLSRPTTAAQIKQYFLGRTGEKNSNEVFSDTLFYPLYNWQGSGMDAILIRFCAALENGTDVRPKSGKVLAERWARWPGFADLLNLYNPQGYCEGFGTNSTTQPDCRLDEPFQGVLSISWTWQYCTEWGFYQASNLGPRSLGSKYNTLKHWQYMCYRQFPDGLPSGYLPKEARAAATNARFGGWYMRPSNTFWTGGEFDPWRTLSPLSNEPFSEHFATTTDIPRCNECPNKRDKLFGYLLDNAQHCYDFDSASVTPASAVPQRLFAQALKQWLPCFGKRKEGEDNFSSDIIELFEVGGKD
ncbi:serine carboxypeptidase S28-domain-containing protein [Kalaharituber pfeilii]|nr:serine carboxypeptidase S28-domain-containing protein [Kalaharituber pfeilii]